MTLVELMVATAVAVVLLGGTLQLIAAQVASQRRLLIEARVHQDLRAAADLVLRDLRRAGRWQAPLAATTWPPLDNPYRAIEASDVAVTYSYSRDAVENHTLDGNERFGFRLSAGTLQALNGGGGWQPLNDPATTVVTRLVITPVIHTVTLGHLCPVPCAAADPGCPSLRVRRYDIQLQARAAADDRVVRALNESVRVRNDELTGTECP